MTIITTIIVFRQQVGFQHMVLDEEIYLFVETDQFTRNYGGVDACYLL